MKNANSGSAILNEFRAAMQHARASKSISPTMRRNFTAASTDRMSAGWQSGGMSINALIESSLDIIRERSRNWSRNDEHGRRFLSLVKNGVVGPDGMKLKMRCGDYIKDKSGYKFSLDSLANTAIENAWRKWCQRGSCDVTGRFSFTDLCRLIIEITARDGEYLVRRVRGNKKTPYQLQLLATERLDVRRRVPPYQGTDVRMGVERNTAGRATSYYVLNYSPTDPRDLGMLNSAAPERVDANDIFHDFISMDAEQIRGVPWSHAVLMGANLLHGFEESAVFAARVGASHMGFYTQDKPEGGPLNTSDVGAKESESDGELITDVEPGLLQLLPPGVDFKSFDAKYPSDAFAPFANNRKQSLATGLDVTYHALTGDMTKVNYSSARIAELAERDGWRGIQQWLVSGFVLPVFKDWLEMSLLAGSIKLPNGSPLPVAKIEKFLEGVMVQPRGWDWVDPVNEAQAAQLALQEGLTSRSKVVAAKGGDFEDNILDLAMEADMVAKHNVTLGDPTKQASQPASDLVGNGKLTGKSKTKPAQQSDAQADPPTDPQQDLQEPA